MCHQIETVKDIVARTTAQMDQVQAEIDNARLVDMTDQRWQLELDRKQEELNQKRQRVELFRTIDSWLDRK